MKGLSKLLPINVAYIIKLSVIILWIGISLTTPKVAFTTPLPVEKNSFIYATRTGNTAPVIIEGKEWSFRTPPPPKSMRIVRPGHPKLLLTPDNLPQIREKLKDPAYAKLLNSIERKAEKGKMLENAFLFQLTGDEDYAKRAKKALLNYSGDYGKHIIFGYDKMSRKLGPVLTFDWIMTTLSRTEKLEIFTHVKDNFKYDYKKAKKVNKETKQAGKYPWYWNNVYNRLPELFLPALAFTIHNEGIDNSWSEEVINWAYDEDETRVVGPYGAKRGSGFLDILMTISLDTGGASGTASYYNYWVEVLHAIAFWETATGQPMWSRTPFMEKGPQALLTSRENVRLGANVMSAIEFMTGISKDTDTASLAKYVLEYYGTSEYHTVYRAILGDLRVTAKSPQELNIPTAGFVRGDHVFYSKSDWEGDDAVTLYVRSPYINVGRGVGSAGVFGIDVGRIPLAPRVIVSKTHAVAGYHSGIWIYDPADTKIKPKHIPYQDRGTYWSDFRSFDAWTTVSKSKYLEPAPTIDITEDYRAISMEYSHRYKKLDVERAQRTIVHIPTKKRNFIVFYDYLETSNSLKSAWQMRFMKEPIIDGNKFKLPGIMTATVISPNNHTIDWVGGAENEFRTPSPERLWYSNRKGGTKPGYSNKAKYLKKFGLGNIYIQPPGQKYRSQNPFQKQNEYLVVLEIGKCGTAKIVNRISDRGVSFGNWVVTFTKEGTFSVKKKVPQLQNEDIC